MENQAESSRELLARFREYLLLLARLHLGDQRGEALVQRSRLLAAAALVLPFLLATSFLGLALCVLVKKREAAIQALLFTSLPAVFLAGWSLMLRWVLMMSFVVLGLVLVTLVGPGFCTHFAPAATLRLRSTS